jgi:hypothetical protein
MIGEDAFCPKTGAPLSEENHYDEQGNSQRATVPDECSPESHLPGELTNGARQSAKAALFNRFRRCHQRHREVNNALYRKAALGLHRLKRAADGQHGWDIYVWYALHQWLERMGFNVEWMHTHVEPRCPDCHGQLNYTLYDNGKVSAQCATNCTADKADKLPAIRKIVASLYSQAFDESIDPKELLRFDQT